MNLNHFQPRMDLTSYAASASIAAAAAHHTIHNTLNNVNNNNNHTNSTHNHSLNLTHNPNNLNLNLNLTNNNNQNHNNNHPHHNNHHHPSHNNSHDDEEEIDDRSNRYPNKIITLETKYQLVKEPQTSQRKLAEKYGMSVRWVNQLLKRKDDIIKEYENGLSPEVGQHYSTVYIDQKVLEYYLERKNSDKELNGTLLKKKALEVAAEAGFTQFKGTDSWLNKFKKRHSIRFKDPSHNNDDRIKQIITNNKQKLEGTKKSQPNPSTNGVNNSSTQSGMNYNYQNYQNMNYQNGNNGYNLYNFNNSNNQQQNSSFYQSNNQFQGNNNQANTSLEANLLNLAAEVVIDSNFNLDPLSDKNTSSNNVVIIPSNAGNTSNPTAMSSTPNHKNMSNNSRSMYNHHVSSHRAPHHQTKDEYEEEKDPKITFFEANIAVNKMIRFFTQHKNPEQLKMFYDMRTKIQRLEEKHNLKRLK